MAASRAPSGSSNPNALPNPAVDLASRLAVARAMAPVIEGQHSQAPVAEALGIPVVAEKPCAMTTTAGAGWSGMYSRPRTTAPPDETSTAR